MYDKVPTDCIVLYLLPISHDTGELAWLLIIVCELRDLSWPISGILLDTLKDWSECFPTGDLGTEWQLLGFLHLALCTENGSLYIRGVSIVSCDVCIIIILYCDAYAQY